VHDLQQQILREPVTAPDNHVAELQEEIDRWSRASLATCWLADAADDTAQDTG
jgi:hypothetical protein